MGWMQWWPRRGNGSGRGADWRLPDSQANCFVVGADYYVPEMDVPSAEIERRAGLPALGLRPGSLEAGTGVKSRRFAAPHEHPSTLATVASERLLKRLGMGRNDVTALLFAANTLDEIEPITAMRVHENLRLRDDVFVADIRDACNSALKAMILGSGLIRSGIVRNVLVAVGERLHDGIYLNIRSRQDLMNRYLPGLTLGDAGAAVLLSAEPPPNARCAQVVYQTWEVDSTQRHLAQIEGGGTRYLSDPEKFFFISNAKKLCQVAADRLPPMIRQVCGKLGWDRSSIGVIPHQVSKGITSTVAKLSGIPLRNFLITLDRFGNTGAATIPMALAMAFENGYAHTFRRILLVGGAAGFSAAVLAIEFLSQQLEQVSQSIEPALEPQKAL
jgi:acyl-CoA:acyl-CoA alkyltransferase